MEHHAQSYRQEDHQECTSLGWFSTLRYLFLDLSSLILQTLALLFQSFLFLLVVLLNLLLNLFCSLLVVLLVKCLSFFVLLSS